MKETTVKISVTQDGLLPEEVTVLGTIFLPLIQKQILKSIGFEKIDDAVFAGVMPVKITTNQKTQIIEFEVGAVSDFRKKVVSFVNQASLLEFVIPEPPVVEEPKPKKTAKSKSAKKTKETTKGKKTAAKPVKKAAAKKVSPAKKKVVKKKTKASAVKKKAIAKKVKKSPVKAKAKKTNTKKRSKK